MQGKTHLLFGILIGFFLINYVDVHPITTLVVLLIASLLPDIDEKSSLLGRKVKILSFFSKHRGFFHSIFFGVLVFIALAILWNTTIGLIFAIGFTGHLLLDAITPMGVQPFYPSKLKIKGFVRVGGIVEKIIFVVFVLLTIFLLLEISYGDVWSFLKENI